MTSILWEGRFRIGQTIVWQSGDEQRTGTVASFRAGAGGYTLFLRTDGGPVTVTEAQVVRADGDGAKAPVQAIAAVDGGEARALAQAVLDGAAVRRPVQQQLRMLAIAVLGVPEVQS